MKATALNWYKGKPTGLDFNKPIFAEKNGRIEMLLPSVERGSTTSWGYNLVGYDWFDLTNGTWASCYNWTTPEAAIAERSGYYVYNAEITIKNKGA